LDPLSVKALWEYKKVFGIALDIFDMLRHCLIGQKRFKSEALSVRSLTTHLHVAAANTRLNCDLLLMVHFMQP